MSLHGLGRKAVVVLLALLLVQAAQAADSSRELTVAVKPVAPFVIQAEDGSYSGISIALWERMAERLGLRFHYQQADLSGLLEGVAKGQFDVGVGALTITAERERRLDFSQPYFASGLAIAVSANATPTWLLLLQRIFSVAFLQAVGALLLVLLVAGSLVWLFERKGNLEEFSDRPVRGIGAGIWWAAVTMTTVGYGDKSPQTLGGRVVGMVWMFTAVIIIASFTASIASSLTVSHLGSKVNGPQDLATASVAVVAASTSANYMDDKGYKYQAYKKLDAALDALAQGRVDALVYDAPLLRYALQQREGTELTVLPGQFERQDYALVVPEGSRLREGLNRSLLTETAAPTWEATLKHYLGADVGR